MSAWAWSVQGVGLKSSSGSMERPFEDSGVIECDSAGGVLEWLTDADPNHHLEKRPFWDLLDQQCACRIEIIPLRGAQ